MARFTIHRRDENEKPIIETLLKRGFQVKKCGPFDLIIAKAGKMALADVKDPKKEGWKQEFTDAQKKFLLDWVGPEVAILRTIEDALKFTL